MFLRAALFWGIFLCAISFSPELLSIIIEIFQLCVCMCVCLCLHVSDQQTLTLCWIYTSKYIKKHWWDLKNVFKMVFVTAASLSAISDSFLTHLQLASTCYFGEKKDLRTQSFTIFLLETEGPMLLTYTRCMSQLPSPPGSSLTA